MTSKHPNTAQNADQTKIDNWFDEFIHDIQTDKFLLKEGIASKETKNIYETLMGEDVEKTLLLGREISDKFFFRKMVIDYMLELKNREATINKLAFDIGSSKILSWVVINDLDEKSEDELIMAEATVNAKYHQYGFHLSTTIIENSDNYPIPSHYNEVDWNN